MSNEEAEIGTHYGKLDMDRVGFFDDPPYGPFDEYVQRAPNFELRQNLVRNRRQMIAPLKGHFFDRGVVKRIFVGEVLPTDGDPKKIKRKPIIPQIQPREMRSPGYPKWSSSPGDWYGCLGKQPKAFDPATKEEPPREEPTPHNFKIKPPTFGGPGYVDICLSPYIPNHLPYEPYDPETRPRAVTADGRRRFFTMFVSRPYFDENPYRSVAQPKGKKKPNIKSKGKSTALPNRFFIYFPQARYFSSFPKHMSDPYMRGEAKRKEKQVKEKPHWKLSGSCNKTKYTISTIERVTNVSCNSKTYTTYRDQVYALR